MRKIRDSYSAQVWLEGSAVSFLDSLYPDDELSVQIARYVHDGMQGARKRQGSAIPSSSRSVQVLRAVSRPSPNAVSPAESATSERMLDLERQNEELRAAISELSSKLSGLMVPSPGLAPPPAHPERVQPAATVPPPSVEVAAEAEPQVLKPKPSVGRMGSNPIGQVQEISQQHKVKRPSYESRGSHPDFECFCRLKLFGKSYFAKGTGPNKKLAKTSAAIAMLEELGYCRDD